MAWYASNGGTAPAFVAKQMGVFGLPGEELWAAAETKYNNGDCWISGWLAFTSQRILWLQAKIGLVPSKSMDEFSYMSSLSLGDRPLSSAKWFVLDGVSFMLPKQEAHELYQYVGQIVQRAAEAQAQSQVPSAAPASKADELAKLAQLRDSGVLSPEEFEREKQRLLS